MSYQVLARKWRPRNFTEMVGQTHVLQALVNALDHDRLHHAYLFTGTRGVGKTTLARILAKSLNCEQGVSSTPCGECAACREIDEGRFVDLIEVDAASRTKVDETRELLENVQYAPTRGRYKVYLIDEVHMFSNHSFNALLKTLEEPPPHVKFLLATTDPQKLPVTILSRCLQFNLKRLPPDMITDHLTAVLEKEGIEAEAGGVRELARAADGSMRDALSLLDQAIAFGGGRVTEAEVRAMLGTIERSHVFDLLEALADGDAPGLMARVVALAEQAPDFGQVLGELVSLLQRLAVAQVVPESLDADLDDVERLRALAGRMSPEDVQLYYQIGLLGRRDLELAPDARGGFEMTLLRMLAFRPAADGGGTAVAAPARASTPAAAQPDPTAAPATKPAAGTGLDDWPALIEALGLRGMTRQLAENCVPEGEDNGVLRLKLDPAFCQLRTPQVEAKLAEALSGHLGRSLKLAFEEAAPAQETPAQQRARTDAERRAAAQQAIESDEAVRALRETFNARVQTDTIEPLD